MSMLRQHSLFRAMVSDQILLLGLAVALVTNASTSGQETRGELLAEVVSQVVKQHVNDCHLVLLTTSPHAPVITNILR